MACGWCGSVHPHRTGEPMKKFGAVNVAGLKADALANAYMKAITKAKRRATLSISGLGWIDESEIETISTARRVEREDPTDEEERVHALKCLHAAGREVGLNHDQLRALAKQHHPGIESLTELDWQQLSVLADVVKDSVSDTDVIDSETGEIIPDGDGMSEIEEEHYATLIAASSTAALNKAAQAIADGGISHPSLREAYRRRRGELQAPAEPGQPLLNISRRVLVESAGV